MKVLRSSNHVNNFFSQVLWEHLTITYKTAMIILPLLLAFLAFDKNMISAEEPPRCPATASQRSIYGMMLKGHVYKTEMAGIGLECVLMCRTDDRCQSFNFVISRHLCEFNDRTKEARPKDFVADPDRYYYSKDINRGNLQSEIFIPWGTLTGMMTYTSSSLAYNY